MSYRHWLSAFALAGLLVGGAVQVQAAEQKTLTTFGQMRAPTAEAARAQAQEWLKSVGKADAATQQAFDAIWSAEDRTLLDRVADTLALGNADAAKLLAGARNPDAAPETVPALLKDAKQNAFFRNNLALAYARALSNRRDYDEVIETLKMVRPEQVVDPAAYFFHKAVAEHSTLKKEDAVKSIVKLLDDVADAPERYRMVAAMMYLDMQAWKEKLDLGHIARLQRIVESRLDRFKGGQGTQKVEREIVARLDELIKKLEKQNPPGGGPPNGGACPGGSASGPPGNTTQPSSPMPDSMPGGASGPGKVDLKELQNKIENWGKLPEKDRAAAMQDLIRNMPVKNPRIAEDFNKRINRGDSK